MMARLLRPSGVWIILILATLTSYASWIDARWAQPRLAGSVVIAIALAKTWLIGMRYMELDKAALPLRLVYDGWILVVGSTLLTMVWLG